jgi:hypothetical protein
MPDKAQISLEWYGGEEIVGYLIKFKIQGILYTYETYSSDTLDRITAIAGHSAGKALSFTKKHCKLIIK